ncbi:DHA2 family efflux MFS transporter permease subunit [Streptomyces sp. NPDC048442]|uniref:DHA2 family efflux MFS transporter permease subunit n=1 Tax=Streptomyces sp. NPDC048442 TaxID=3154823 RepID=UPI00344A8B38
MFTQPTTSVERDPRRWAILAVICLAQLVVLLDNTVLNVAIPVLTADLGASTADIQWMVNAYALVQSGLLLTAGSLADRYGRKLLLLTGLSLFGLGSAAAAFAQSSGQLVAARAGMGVGGALLATTTLAVIMQIFDDEERPKAIGVWGAVSSLGIAAGPLIGGVILDNYWWGAIFLINVPVALLGLVAVFRLVPETKSPQGKRPDYLGAVLSMIGMVGVVYAIISGPEHGWLSAQVLLSAVVGVLALSIFARWELHVGDPMLDMGFFRNRRFNGAVAGAMLVALGMAGSMFLLTQHLQLVLGYDALQAGLRTAPLALTIVCLNFLGAGAKLLAKLGESYAIALGMTMLSAGLVVVAVLGSGPGAGYGGILVGLVIMGSGISLALPAMTVAIMSSIPTAKAGVGAGVQGTLTEFGGGLGVAVLGAVLGSRFAAQLPAGAGAPGSLAEALAQAGADPARLREVHQAFGNALSASQLIGAAAVFVGGLLAGLLLRLAGQASAETGKGTEKEAAVQSATASPRHGPPPAAH